MTAPQSGQPGVSLSFTATATDISNAVQAAGFTYSWNFGDGGSATGATPSHAFAAAGSYTVSATATDEYGKTGMASGTIVISDANSTATTYTLTAPNPATGPIGTPSGSFTVALPDGQTLTSAVTVTPSDGGAGGTFTPTQVSLSSSDHIRDLHIYAGKRRGDHNHHYEQRRIDRSGTGPFLGQQPGVNHRVFDFGTETSPVAPGYTRIDVSTPWYSSAQGYGWIKGNNIQERDRGTGSSLNRDFDAVNPGDFLGFQIDVPNGVYSVTLTSGDESYSFSKEAIYLQNSPVDTLSSSSGQILTRTYQVVVSAGESILGASMPSGGAIDGLAINEVAAAPTVAAGLNLAALKGRLSLFRVWPSAPVRWRINGTSAMALLQADL